MKEDGSIKNARDSATCPYRTIMIFFPVKIKGKQIANQQTYQIDKYEFWCAHRPYNHICKEIKREHIKEQMGIVYVQESGREHT